MRRGFGAFLEVPVIIRNPDKRIGTHVFTAVARTDAGLRWTAVTIDSGDDAKSALDRITIPQDVLDRIGPTAFPRSSIIISDEPLNRETNDRSEFVVVLNNQPQGGLAMRRPPKTPLRVVTHRTTTSSASIADATGTPHMVDPRWRAYYDPRQNGRSYYQRQNGQYYYQRQQGWW